MNIPIAHFYQSIGLRQNNTAYSNTESLENQAYTEASGPQSDYGQVITQYIQQCETLLYQLEAGNPLRSTYEAYLKQAQDYYRQYAEQIGLDIAANPSLSQEWDPLNASYQNHSGISPSYQDLNKVIYEQALPPMTADKKDLREEHFYAPPYDFTVPDSATAHVTSEVDPNHPDQTRACVTLTWPDGTVKKHYFYHVDWKENGLTIRAISPENQITLDASIAANSHVTTAEMGEVVKTTEEIAAEEKEFSAVNPEAPSDTPPSSLSEDGKTATYDKEADPAITVYPNGPSQNKISASGTLALNPYRQSDEFYIDFDGEKFTITVQTSNEKGEEKTLTYIVDGKQIDKIMFNGIDKSKIHLTLEGAGKMWGTSESSDFRGRLTDGEGEILFYSIDWYQQN